MLDKIILDGIKSQKKFLETVYEVWTTFHDIDVLKLHKLYAKQIGKSVNQLSETDKRQALLDVILEKTIGVHNVR